MTDACSSWDKKAARSVAEYVEAVSWRTEFRPESLIKKDDPDNDVDLLKKFLRDLCIDAVGCNSSGCIIGPDEGAFDHFAVFKDKSGKIIIASQPILTDGVSDSAEYWARKHGYIFGILDGYSWYGRGKRTLIIFTRAPAESGIEVKGGQDLSEEVNEYRT